MYNIRISISEYIISVDEYFMKIINKNRQRFPITKELELELEKKRSR